MDMYMSAARKRSYMSNESFGSATGQTDGGTPYTVTFDWHDDCDVGAIVVDAVESVSGRAPTDLPRLHAVLDADALHRIFKPRPDGSRPETGRVAFQYADCDVTVHASGRVVVETGEN
jgi:hypothetical protein